MTRYLIILSLFYSVSVAGQNFNYEMAALNHYIDNIESRKIFKKACDCTFYKYDLKKTLVVYDSSLYEIDPIMLPMTFEVEWHDSLLWTTLNSEKVQIRLDTNAIRIKLTDNYKNFNPDHYLVRFSERLEFKDWIIIAFNIKSERQCSGVDFYFLFNSNREIERYKMVILCDSHG